MRSVLLCPKCGDIIFPCIVNSSIEVCNYCNTKRIDIGEVVKDSEIVDESDSELLVKRIYRIYLYNNPLFDKAAYKKRLKKNKVRKKSIIECIREKKRKLWRGAQNPTVQQAKRYFSLK